jgi:type VI secretion system protein ImpK
MTVDEVPVSVVFDQSATRRLSEVFAPCFTLILQLRASSHYGESSLLRTRIKEMLDRAGRDALRAGFSPDEAGLARFALVAFIDETILSSEWEQRETWLARPLQLELFDRYDAGEEFFVRLEELRGQGTSQAELVEVYYLCMALGFKGKYQLHGQEQLRLLIEETYAQLSRVPGFGPGQLAPNARPRDQVVTEVKSKLPVWVIVVAAVAIAVLVYLGMSYYISETAASAARSLDRLP